ncbi:hypothetical protein WA026_011278 [Henosepilachna vigintioctopunctata]|uniref:DDE-1 domain-containing protein n=1 Tax=Henosepilachna vigintioctopunctata TaxID=420089 RepID=A0AAW1TX45_9CUCU
MNANLLRGDIGDSGWIIENLFVDWLHHFISFAKPTLEEPILLILDNHESHVNLACYQLCRQNGIILMSLALFTKAFNRISNIEKTANGFHVPSIWPIDTTKFDEKFVDAATLSFENLSNLQRAQRPAIPLVMLNESIPLKYIVNDPILPQQKRTKKEDKEQIKESEKTASTNKGKKEMKNLRGFENENFKKDEQKRNVPCKKKKANEGTMTDK